MTARTLSLILLVGGGLAISAGVYVALGLGFGLIALGVLMVAADFLVPTR